MSPVHALDTLENHLAKAIKVGNSFLVMDLIFERVSRGTSVLKRPCGGRKAHLGPSPETILDHGPLGYRCGNIDHMIAIVFLAHAWLTVAADRKAEVLVLC